MDMMIKVEVKSTKPNNSIFQAADWFYVEIVMKRKDRKHTENSRLWETLNLSTDAEISINTIFLLIFEVPWKCPETAMEVQLKCHLSAVEVQSANSHRPC